MQRPEVQSRREPDIRARRATEVSARVHVPYALRANKEACAPPALAAAAAPPIQPSLAGLFR